MQHAIRQQLRLSEDELREAVACTVDAAGYVALLRAKGIAPAAPEAQS